MNIPIDPGIPRTGQTRRQRISARFFFTSIIRGLPFPFDFLLFSPNGEAYEFPATEATLPPRTKRNTPDARCALIIK